MTNNTSNKSTKVGRRNGKPAPSRVTATANPEKQLDAFIAKFDEPDQRLIRAVRRAVRKRFPTAHELVYDNYNYFVIGYSPTQRPSDAIVSIAARANSVGLCFIHGAALPDPKKLLLGSGNQTRFIRLESAQVLAHPDVETLIAAAIARSKATLPATGRGSLIIRSVAAKQRPRRKEKGGATRQRSLVKSAARGRTKETSRATKR